MNYLKEHWNFLKLPGSYPGVDLLRAIAVSLVVLQHFSFLQFGWIGVDLFFVISGFLIGGMILDKLAADNFSMKAFYARRALRILPTYYFVMFLCFCFRAEGPVDSIALKSILSGMLFLQTTGAYFFPAFFTLNYNYVVGGSWSLVIEEMFYLGAPLILLLFVKAARRNSTVVTILIGLTALSAIWVRFKMTSAFAPDDPNWHWASFTQFHSRYDELTIGVFAAALIRGARDVRAQSAWWLTAGGVFFWLFLSYLYGKPEFLAKPFLITRDTIWLPTVLGAAGGALLLGSYWWDVNAAPIIVLARLSYPLYLMHIFFLEVIGPYSDRGVLALLRDMFSLQGRYVILIFASVMLSYLTSLLIEYPFVRLYKRPKYEGRRTVPLVERCAVR